MYEQLINAKYQKQQVLLIYCPFPPPKKKQKQMSGKPPNLGFYLGGIPTYKPFLYTCILLSLILYVHTLINRNKLILSILVYNWYSLNLHPLFLEKTWYIHKMIPMFFDHCHPCIPQPLRSCSYKAQLLRFEKLICGCLKNGELLRSRCWTAEEKIQKWYSIYLPGGWMHPFEKYACQVG